MQSILILFTYEEINKQIIKTVKCQIEKPNKFSTQVEKVKKQMILNEINSRVDKIQTIHR